MNRGMRESMRIVVQAGEVTRVDSTGMGLLVRFLSHAQNRGGDLRLAATPPFLDNLLRSPDLCAFVRTLLQHHGYEVLFTCRMHDAKAPLSAANVDYIVLGPDSSSLPPERTAASLKSLAPQASTVLLQNDFKHGDAEQAGLELLRLMQHRPAD
jgi:hypothetical protein